LRRPFKAVGIRTDVRKIALSTDKWQVRERVVV
jgi:hypothetical protein